ncbi:hypothetical protein BASA60_002107 [Batrachochytrium salamandrivorans]|nr:hypothetical protein BASA62_005282 [Batrachochytrium salamandrivorans]KAH6582140.1 hypothetical protein BASA60_002107 [Batrachochytrium salamandrivorans]
MQATLAINPGKYLLCIFYPFPVLVVIQVDSLLFQIHSGVTKKPTSLDMLVSNNALHDPVAVFIYSYSTDTAINTDLADRNSPEIPHHQYSRTSDQGIWNLSPGVCYWV